jgi:hypothetical protein
MRHKLMIFIVFCQRLNFFIIFFDLIKPFQIMLLIIIRIKIYLIS